MANCGGVNGAQSLLIRGLNFDPFNSEDFWREEDLATIVRLRPAHPTPYRLQLIRP